MSIAISAFGLIEPATAVEVIRATAQRVPRLPDLADRVGVDPIVLRDFLYGRTQLGPDVLKSLTLVLWDGTFEFDLHKNALLAAKAAPRR